MKLLDNLHYYSTAKPLRNRFLKFFLVQVGKFNSVTQRKHFLNGSTS
jgi:hypothetical protein